MNFLKYYFTPQRYCSCQLWKKVNSVQIICPITLLHFFNKYPTFLQHKSSLLVALVLLSGYPQHLKVCKRFLQTEIPLLSSILICILYILQCPVFYTFTALTKIPAALTNVAQLVGCHSSEWKVVGSIPRQSTFLGSRFGPWWRCKWEATNDVSISHHCCSPSFLLPFPLSKNK